ncbi:MAG: hypothetical protein DUD34_10665 [Lactobacillus sp.]|nr:MAG: hypothetical protein DUD34_10665 [Lactobacillus sp.]
MTHEVTYFQKFRLKKANIFIMIFSFCDKAMFFCIFFREKQEKLIKIECIFWIREGVGKYFY